jgi:hypothetical protein
VHVFHDQLTALPTVTVFDPGLNALFVTEIPPAGGGVLPGGWLFFGAVEPPLPPHAAAEITASAIQTFLGCILSPRALRARTICVGVDTSIDDATSDEVVALSTTL